MKPTEWENMTTILLQRVERDIAALKQERNDRIAALTAKRELLLAQRAKPPRVNNDREGLPTRRALPVRYRGATPLAG